MHDLIVIGGGPAGLSAALNSAAEGLSVALMERSDVLGGQAGTSSRIENYLGFDEGVSGDTLTREAQAQAERLGATMFVGCEVAGLEHNEATGLWVVESESEVLVAPAVLVATGVDYRTLSVPGGTSDLVRYGASAAEHAECFGRPVIVVGGGNSAGQAALSLSRSGAHVTLLVRSPLRSSMSQYLVERIARDRGINCVLGEVVEVHGVGVTTTKGFMAAECVFAYIGSTPRTAFLGDFADTDASGFVVGEGFVARAPGLFVAGDVRSGSAKRVAVAAGEGAIVSSLAWRFVNGAVAA